MFPINCEVTKCFKKEHPIIFLVFFVEIASKLEKIGPTFLSFNLFPSSQSVEPNGRNRINVIIYRKIPKISPGAYIFQRPFLRGLFLEGFIFGGAYTWRGLLSEFYGKLSVVLFVSPQPICNLAIFRSTSLFHTSPK